jgi:chromosomal replication initiation ATPase DnaA
MTTEKCAEALREFREAFNELMRAATQLTYAIEVAAGAEVITTQTRMETVSRMTAAAFEMSPRVLTGRGRMIHEVEPRWIAMFLCKELFNVSYQAIGLTFNRDHGTVINACNGLRRSMEQDPQLVTRVQSIRSMVRQALHSHRDAA